jgi:hypothetical protein
MLTSVMATSLSTSYIGSPNGWGAGLLPIFFLKNISKKFLFFYFKAKYRKQWIIISILFMQFLKSAFFFILILREHFLHGSVCPNISSRHVLIMQAKAL